MQAKSLSPKPLMQPKALTIVSYLAPNWFWFYEAIAAYLKRALQVKSSLTQSQFDPLNDSVLQRDELDLAFICGLPFIRQHQASPSQLQAVVAPVMQLPRYGDRPLYFADVVVNAASDVSTFADLAGRTLCYNDPGSNSGYYLLRHRLIQKGYSHHFFGKVIQSGSHQRSIQWVAEGQADCAAIDSTVLERELQAFPALSRQIRVLEAIGPCPMPPLVAAQHLGSAFIHQLRESLLQPDAELKRAMQQAGVQRFAAVESDDYQSIASLYKTVLQTGHEL